MLDSFRAQPGSRQGKHPHNVYEMELFTESIPSGWILSTQLLAVKHPFLLSSSAVKTSSSRSRKNGENGKYCASYYLFTYLHFSFLSLLPLHHPLEQAEAGGSDKYLLETFGCALWVCTQRLNFINWQRQKESFSYLDPSR